MIEIIPVYRDNNEVFGIIRGALFVGTIKLTDDMKYEYAGVCYENAEDAKAAAQLDADAGRI